MDPLMKKKKEELIVMLRNKECSISLLEKTNEFQYKTLMMVGILLDRYKFHDLRVNRGDLPKPDAVNKRCPQVIVYTEWGTTIGMFSNEKEQWLLMVRAKERNFFSSDIDLQNGMHPGIIIVTKAGQDQIFGWRYIPTMEEK